MSNVAAVCDGTYCVIIGFQAMFLPQMQAGYVAYGRITEYEGSVTLEMPWQAF